MLKRVSRYPINPRLTHYARSHIKNLVPSLQAAPAIVAKLLQILHTFSELSCRFALHKGEWRNGFCQRMESEVEKACNNDMLLSCQVFASLELPYVSTVPCLKAPILSIRETFCLDVKTGTAACAQTPRKSMRRHCTNDFHMLSATGYFSFVVVDASCAANHH